MLMYVGGCACLKALSALSGLDLPISHLWKQGRVSRLPLQLDPHTSLTFLNYHIHTLTEYDRSKDGAFSHQGYLLLTLPLMAAIGRDALWQQGRDETVEVNQRALIDKVGFSPRSFSPGQTITHFIGSRTIFG